jgi:acetyl esterase
VARDGQGGQLTAAKLAPQARAFVELTADQPPLETLGVEEARAGMRAAIPLFGEPAQLADVCDDVVRGRAGEIPVRIYRPRLGGALPAIVHLHGGGWVLGDLDTHDSTCRDLAAGSGCAVVAVDYRLAPEHPFPAALEDSLTAVRAVGQLGLDPERVAVFGDSAGGGMAAVIARELRGALRHQALVYPVCDARLGATASYASFAEDAFMTAADMRWFLGHYAPGVDPADPRLSPLAADDLTGAAPATIVLAECDPLHDEGVAYASRLEQAGVAVELREYPGQLHPFFMLAGVIDDGADARAWVARRLGEALH